MNSPNDSSSLDMEMRVLKRNGNYEDISFDKILKRVKILGHEANLNLNYTQFVMKVIDQLYDGISTSQIDELAAEQCASLITTNQDYGVLASRIVISNCHKKTPSTFYEAMDKLYNFKDVNGKHSPLLSDKAWNFIINHKDFLNNLIEHQRDYLIDYFGFKTLERSYLMRVNKDIIERPQYMWLRVSVGIHGVLPELDMNITLQRIRETYELMSQKYFIHATPTLYNAATPRPQLSSCYLIAMENDSIDGIFNTLKECAQISKWAGGIGLHIHNVRGYGTHIRGTNGHSNGIVPMLRVFNSTARYVDQGGGKRNGSFAIYLEPWHSDIFEFLDLRKNHGDEELRARDLFYALWIPDLFMERVNANGEWSLFCPDICPGLSDAYGDKFKELYLNYEQKGLAKKTVKARDLWFAILDSQMETGTPYLLYKDASNMKSNQKNLGTIKSSNLCVSGDTKILTSQGNLSIQEIVDQDVEVWNGQEFSKVTIRQTGQNQKLIKILLSNGAELECTPYHKFYIEDEKQNELLVEAQNLIKGMKIPKYKLPKNDNSFEYFDISIIDIIDENKYADTYCFNEPLRHRGIFNGILTSQCTEILEYSDENETAVCNLASIALNRFVQDKEFDYNLLVEVTKVVTRNLNKVIDVNFYPTEKTQRSNMRHRPIGIGVQGLADTFALMDIPFHSEEAREVNKKIFESIYYGALLTSNELSKDRLSDIEMGNIKYEYIQGPNDNDVNRNTRLGSYSTFYGSPMSEGKFQFDLWNVTPSNRYDWESLRTNIIKYGLRNSLLVAPMPTASTSQILGNNECFEPFTSNIYSRRTLAGEFIIANKYLMKELQELGLWNNSIKDNIIANKGSIQHIEGIPENIKNKYKIVWEIPMRHLIDMASERGPYICQSQSMNLWVEDPNYKTLTAMHFYSWKSGLKTGIYYLRRKPKHQAQQFTIVPKNSSSNENNINKEEDEVCEMCSG